MHENDTALIRWTDLPVALALLTRLPLPKLPDSAFARQASATWAFPVAGFVVGAIAVGVVAIGLSLGLPIAVVAGLCLTTQIIVTGAMHEDGLADTVDGFWGGWTPERRLEIMKDSHIGTYGVLALVLSVGLRWAALSVVLATNLWAILAVALLSRAVLPAVMTALPRARPGGLSDQVGQPPMAAVWTAGLIGVAGALVLTGPTGLILIGAMALTGIGVAALARTKIGGQTGDVLGATQHMTELVCLILLAAAR